MAMSSIFRSWIQLPPGIQQWKEQHAMVRCRACMKIIFFLDAGRLLRDKGIQLSWRKFRYVSAFIFKPSGTLNGPTSSLPITPAQNMTPPPHCCRLTLDGLLQPFTSQPLHKPSGPLRVALHSSVERTAWTSVLTFSSLISVPGGWGRVNTGFHRLGNCVEDPATSSSGDFTDTCLLKYLLVS